MADGKNTETNRFAVPYDENLDDKLPQPSTQNELNSSIMRHPSASPLPKPSSETPHKPKNTGK